MTIELNGARDLPLIRTAGIIIGYFALALGLVGSVMATAAAFASIWFGLTAPTVVEDALAPVYDAVDRLDDRLDEATDSVRDAGGSGELQARIQGVADVAADAEERLGAIDDHPVFGQLPVDTSELSNVLDAVGGISQELNGELATREQNAVVAAAVKNRITDRLGEAKSQLATVDERIVEVENQLRTWIRLAAVVGVLLCLWGLWAQLVLARWGWKTARPTAKADEEDEPQAHPDDHSGDHDGDESLTSDADRRASSATEQVHAFVIEPNAMASGGETSAIATLAEQLMNRSNGAITVNINVAIDDGEGQPLE